MANTPNTLKGRKVAVLGNFITSRKPDDLPAFNKTLIAQLSRAAA